MSQNKTKNTKEKAELMSFLKLTKEGKYAPIEKSSLNYTRMKEQNEDIIVKPNEDNYYFSLS